MKARARVYSEEFKNQALDLMRSGLTAYAVAQQLGMGHATADQWRREAGIPASQRVYSAEVREEVLALMRRGVSSTDAGKPFGVPASTAQTWWKRSGETRPSAKAGLKRERPRAQRAARRVDLGEVVPVPVADRQAFIREWFERRKVERKARERRS